MTEYLTVYKGREQRKPRPFNREEFDAIVSLMDRSDEELMAKITQYQDQPRSQRLIQEAIERKRRG